MMRQRRTDGRPRRLRWAGPAGEGGRPVSGTGPAFPTRGRRYWSGWASASDDAAAPELMARAVEAAGQDAGAHRPARCRRPDRRPQGSWAYADPARLVAGRVGAPGARTHLVELGIPQQAVINYGPGSPRRRPVGGGRGGGRARPGDGSGTRAATGPGWGCRKRPGPPPTSSTGGTGPLLEPVEVAHRLWEPVQQYAMIDNALRAERHQTLEEHRVEIAALWDGFNLVARDNPAAAFPAPMDAAADRHALARQPTLGLPLQQVARQPVDRQPGGRPPPVHGGGGRTLRGAPRPLDLPAGRPGVQPLRLPPAPTAALRLAGHGRPGSGGRGAGRPVGRRGRRGRGLQLLPRRRPGPTAELGLDLPVAPTVTGGMAFAGGPFNNFVYQAMAPVVAALRVGTGGGGRGDHGERPADQARASGCGRPGPTGGPPWWPTWPPRPSRRPVWSMWSKSSTATTGLRGGHLHRHL